MSILVTEKKRLSELARRLELDANRLLEAYHYSVVETEPLEDFSVSYRVGTTRTLLAGLVEELEYEGGDPRLIAGAQKLHKIAEKIEHLIDDYDLGRYDLVFKGYKEIRGEKKIPVYRAVLDKRLVRRLREDFKEFNEVVGRKCGFSIPYRDDVTVAEALNDLSNCVHVLAEELMKSKNMFKKVTDRVRADESADRDLLEIAVMWDKALDIGWDKDLYMDTDVDSTHAYIVDGRAYFRVGSSEGHATTLEKKDDTLVLKYYDEDEEVNNGVVELLEDRGDCECEKLSDGVKCKCKLTPRTKKAVALTMALATSMDIRLGEGEDLIDQLKHYKELEAELDKSSKEIEEVLSKWT